MSGLRCSSKIDLNLNGSCQGVRMTQQQHLQNISRKKPFLGEICLKWKLFIFKRIRESNKCIVLIYLQKFIIRWLTSCIMTHNDIQYAIYIYTIHTKPLAAYPGNCKFSGELISRYSWYCLVYIWTHLSHPQKGQKFLAGSCSP